jgi:hypothetical protein
VNKFEIDIMNKKYPYIFLNIVNSFKENYKIIEFLK